MGPPRAEESPAPRDPEEIVRDVREYLARQERKDLLRFLTCGNVDDGKSTLIGRLLHDSKLVYEDQLAAVRADSARYGTTGGDLDLALLVDGLQAEREQGITIDVAYRYFSTARRKFIIADTPGHEQYTRNMATGASTCDLAIILIDARHGVQTQTRRHTYIATLLGIRHIVVAVNKMDLVDYREEVFERIRRDYEDFADRLEVPDVHFIPISALKGDNVVHPSPHMPWYRGSTLMYLLENIHIASDRNLSDLRFPVQLVSRPNLDFRGYMGTIASGIVRRGDEVLILPSRKTNRVKSIVTFDGELPEAFAPMAVTLTLEKEVDVSRGDMIVHPDNLPHVDGRFEAMLVWMAEEPLKLGRSYFVKHATKLLGGQVTALRYRVDVNTLAQEPASELKLNEIGHAVVELSEPVAFDAYRKNRATGAFIVIDRLTHNTVGAGMILDRETADRRAEVDRLVEESLRRYAERRASRVTPEERARRLGHRPATLLLTGLVGAGKGTLAVALERALFDRGVLAQVLDGGNARFGSPADPDFDPHGSAEAFRRVAEAAKLLNDAGAVALLAFVAARADERALVRRIVGAERLLEIYLSTRPEICRRRDAAGLYARAEVGQIPHFPGVTAPYEPPRSPDLALDTYELSVEACVERVLELLRSRGVVP
jgi:bifunctional enzyme CysN/CysC